MTNRVLFIFCPIIRRPKSCDGVLPNRLRHARHLSQIYSNDAADFRLVVASCHSAEPSKSEAPSPSLFSFFSSLHLPPKTMGKRPPPRVPPVRIASLVPPTPPTPSIGWLSRLLSKWRPPKTGAPPISHFFDGRHFGAPNKGIEGSSSEPSRRAPQLGARGAAAQRFGSMADVAMDRGSKAAGR